jgi:hypothetical protein
MGLGFLWSATVPIMPIVPMVLVMVPAMMRVRATVPIKP